MIVYVTMTDADNKLYARVMADAERWKKKAFRKLVTKRLEDHLDESNAAKPYKTTIKEEAGSRK